jgi:hypothetical protein
MVVRARASTFKNIEAMPGSNDVFEDSKERVPRPFCRLRTLSDLQTYGNAKQNAQIRSGAARGWAANISRPRSPPDSMKSSRRALHKRTCPPRTGLIAHISSQYSCFLPQLLAAPYAAGGGVGGAARHCTNAPRRLRQNRHAFLDSLERFGTGQPVSNTGPPC